jgi:hypothetical protein
MSARTVIELIQTHLPQLHLSDLRRSLHLPRPLHIQSLSELDEAYLGQSVDLTDLERRLHEVDARGVDNSAGLWHDARLH